MTIKITNDLTQIDYPRYERYKDSGVDWLGEIPEGWDTRRLKYVLSERNERSKTGEEPLLMVSQKYGLVIRADYHDKATVALSSIDSKIVHKNDLVFNKLKAHLGVFYKSEIDLKGIVSPDYAVYRSKAYIEDLKFLELLFKLPIYIQQFIIRATGVAEGLIRLYTSELFDLPVPIPPLIEQKKILEFIDNKFVQIDQAIALKQQQIAKLEEYKQVVIQSAVTKGLSPDAPMKDSGVDWIGNIPEHWGVKRLMFVTENFNKKVLSSESDLPYLGMESIESKTGQLSNESSEAEGLAAYFKKGQILFGKLRPYLAKVYLTNSEGLCSTEFMVMSVRPEISNTFLKYQLLSNRFIAQVNSSTYGTKMPRANAEYIKRQSVTLPPLQEQQLIVRYIDTITNQTNQTLSSYKTQIDRLKEYKTILINQAVTGKIKVS
ncbi:restriction endonuclease subunit S [Psychrobacter celer]|uniref:restriction endonuclease subunit S n=1 Tax=Psychrobacter celer TaxID=306572 RepID=UPI003FD5CDBB